MEISVLTSTLKKFIIYLEVIPSNLRLTVHTLLFFLATIDIVLTVYTNIDNENFSYYKWIKSKILKLGFIIFAINQYEWLLEGTKDFFFYIIERATRIPIAKGEYFEDPSLLFDKGAELAYRLYDEGVSFWHASSWIYGAIALFVLIGFIIITIRLIICWVEFYFLTGISIIFLPFGVLDIGLDFYKNVFKTIISCCIKLMVMNFWIILSTEMLENLLKIKVESSFSSSGLIFCITYILVAMVTALPSLTTSLLTGSPSVNASAAMAGATGAVKGMARGVADVYRGGKEVVKGAWKGGQAGANVGGAAGTALGSLAGPVGMSVGKIVGGTIGAVGGATVGGSYAGVRYAIFKEKAKVKVNNGNSNNTSSGSSGGSSSSSGGGSNNSSTSQNPSNSSANTNPQPPSNNPSSGGSSGNSSPGNGNNGGSPSNSSTPQNPSNSNDSTNSVADNSPPANTNTDTTNNVSESSTNTLNTTSTDTSTSSENEDNVTTTDTGDSTEKRGIKVNGGEAGKLPDWMDGDY